MTPRPSVPHAAHPARLGRTPAFSPGTPLGAGRRRRKPKLTPMQRWQEQHVLAPARRIFETAPETIQEECWDCDGTGHDDIFDEFCRTCSGSGWQQFDMPDDVRRKIIDRRLRAAGLDPACFDDNGRLIDAADRGRQ